MTGGLMDVPVLLEQFLALSCGLSAGEAHCCGAVCPSRRARRLPTGWSGWPKRRPMGVAAIVEANSFVAVLDPQALILALERAVESGHACRSEASKIEEAIFAEMTAQGTWR